MSSARKPKATTVARKNATESRTPSSKSKTARSKTARSTTKPDVHTRRSGVYVSSADQCAEMTTQRTRCRNSIVPGTMFCKVHQRKPQQHEDDFFDSTFARVIDGVWIGSLDTANDPKALRSAGIKSIVNISGWEPRQKTRDLYRLWKPAPIKYYTTTTRDRHTGKLRYLGDEPISSRHGLAEFYDYMDRGAKMIAEAPKPVLVNCHAGINRSASIIAAYLMKYKGMTFAQAHAALLNANRKRDTPVLTNRYFVHALQRYPH